jgi:hypothetical protein
MRICRKCGLPKVATRGGLPTCRDCQPRCNTRRKLAPHTRRNTVTGESHGRAKLTATQVADIRRRVAEGERVTALGREFGVAYTTVQLIRDGKIWGPRAVTSSGDAQLV